MQPNNEKEPLYVVGIGASAGSLNILQKLVTEFPVNMDVCFVLIQHLEPSSPTMLPEILAKKSPVTVKLAEQGETLLPDHIYIAPPGKQLHISNMSFSMYDSQHQQNTVSYPINRFFCSLAEQCQNRSAAVILSGTGSDGSRGVVYVKDHGGLVLVLDPRLCEFNGMPENAINTGAVDKICTPDEILHTLINYRLAPHNTAPEKIQKQFENSQEAVQEILMLLRSKTNIDFTQYKETTLKRRIAHQIGLCKSKDLNEYLGFITSNDQALHDLKRDILIGVTQFFRDLSVWERLKSDYLPQLLNEIPDGDTIRAWSPGCATGEEAYTLAMILDEMAHGRDIKIFATDLDHSNISFASEGIYPAATESEVPVKYLNTYFQRLPSGEFKVTDSLRKKVVFAHHDLLTSPPFSNMHVVCCRNTLIYFQQEIQRKAISILHFALKKSGILVLGLAENPPECEPYFGVHDGKCRIFYKRLDRFATEDKWPYGHSDLQRTLPIRPTSLPRPSSRPVEPLVKRLIRQAREALSDAYIPPTLLINENFSVIFSFGDTSDFTKHPKPGKVDNHLSNIVADSLIVPITSALNHIKKNSGEHKVPGIHVSNAATPFLCDIQVRSIEEEEPYQKGYLIIFLKNQAVLESEAYPDVTTENRIHEMEQAINEMYEERKELEEELHFTREELQSVNEELMAANEELQTTNEELQSVNEELFTLNSEYQHKIDDLTKLNNDLDNLLNCTDFGTLFLDAELNVRRFTPKVTRFINLKATDADRNIADFTLNFEFANFIAALQSCINEKKVVTRLCENSSSTRVKVTLSPYIVAKHQCEGVVVTFSENDES